MTRRLFPGASSCEMRGEAKGWGAGGTAVWGGGGNPRCGWLVGSLLLTREILEFKCYGKEPVRRKLMIIEEREGIPGGVCEKGLVFGSTENVPNLLGRRFGDGKLREFPLGTSNSSLEREERPPERWRRCRSNNRGDSVLKGCLRVSQT